MQRTFTTIFILSLVLAVLPGCGQEEGLHPENMNSQASPAIIDWENIPVGGVVFVPLYSNIFHIDLSRTTDLTATLSIYNTDRSRSINIVMVDYYDDRGKLIKNFSEKETTLKPLATYHIVIAEKDRRGGTGAKILVGWSAREEVSCPLVETKMIHGQGISFTSRGVTIFEQAPELSKCKSVNPG